MDKCSAIRIALAAAAVMTALAPRAQADEVSATGPAASGATSSAPASRPAGVVAFQPGVTIDWPARRVVLDAEVVLRSGPLELLACSPRTKEHESILRVRVRPMHVFQALGLLGLEPGHPPYYDAQRREVVPAAGDRLDVLLEWTQDGRRRLALAEQWLRDRKTDAPAGPVEWVFAGSVLTPDGDFYADLEGTVVCVVDFDGALVGPRTNYSASNESLWAEARTEAIPPAGTPVRLILQPAARRLTVGLDRFGRVQVNGRVYGLREVIQQIRDAQQQPDPLIVVLEADAAAPDAQARQIAWALEAAGSVLVTTQTATSQPAPAHAGTPTTSVEQQGREVLAALAGLGEQLPALIDDLAARVREGYRAFNERVTALGRAAEGAARVVSTQQEPPQP